MPDRDYLTERPLRVTMVLRGSVRNDPRVLKEAETLAGAGARVCVVANKLPDERGNVERVRPRVIAVRTTTGFVQKLRSLLGRGSAPGGGAALDGPGGLEGAGRQRGTFSLLLMLVSRVLLMFKMAGLVVRTRPDVVHAHDFNTLATGYLAARYCRARLIYDAHEINLGREGYYRRLRRLIGLMEGFLIRRCDGVITTTGLRARHFRRIHGLAATPTVLQNRPVAQAMPVPLDLRARFGIPKDSLLLLYQGGLQAGRGLHGLINAVARVDGVHLVLIGDGHQKQALRELIAELGMEARVHLHAKVAYAALPAVTAGADMGVQVIRNTCFNHWSTDSNKLFEYVQAGLGVIASDFPEIRRVVRGHGLGVLVNPADTDELVRVFHHLQRHPQEVARYRSHARAAAQVLNWCSEAPKLLALYPALRAFNGPNPIQANVNQEVPT